VKGATARALVVLQLGGLLAACGAPDLSTNDGGRMGDANTQADADAASAADGLMNHDGAAADAAACTAFLVPDAGSLEDLPIDQFCQHPFGNGAMQWECLGSIVVVHSVGPDCADYYLFDATTKALQAKAHGCSGNAICTDSVPGFTFPSACVDMRTPLMDLTELCPQDGSVLEASADTTLDMSELRGSAISDGRSDGGGASD
jgi:hypothetical protein